MLDNKNVIIAAHGNSLRALSKYIEGISDEDIINLEMATGEPVVYDFDDKLNVVSKIIELKQNGEVISILR